MRNHAFLALLAATSFACSAAPGGTTTANPGPPHSKPLITTSTADAEPAVDSVKPELAPDSRASAPDPGFVGDDDRIERDTLRFATPAEADAYDTLEGCFEKSGEDWFAYPRRRFGNFVNVEWCRGPGAHINCAGGQTRTATGAGWASLEVLQYERDWPSVFGLSFTTGDIPETDGLGVAFSWSAGGRSVLGDGVSASFTEVRAGNKARRASVGLRASFDVGLDPIEVSAPGSAEDFVRRIRASPQGLRAEILGRLSALEAAVDAALIADTPRKCIYGEYKGRGIPPACEQKVPLDEDDKAEVRARLASFVDPQRALTKESAPQMHARLLELLPERCWSPRD